MLNPSKTNYHKEGTGNADDQHWVLPYPIIVCGEALLRVWLQEMFLRHTALHICMYIHKYIYIYKERNKIERESRVERESGRVE